MTLNELLAAIPEKDRDLPLCILDPRTGYSHEIADVKIEDAEYLAALPPPPASMSEATKSGQHVLLQRALRLRPKGER